MEPASMATDLEPKDKKLWIGDLGANADLSMSNECVTYWEKIGEP